MEKTDIGAITNELNAFYKKNIQNANQAVHTIATAGFSLSNQLRRVPDMSLESYAHLYLEQMEMYLPGNEIMAGTIQETADAQADTRTIVDKLKQYHQANQDHPNQVKSTVAMMGLAIANQLRKAPDWSLRTYAQNYLSQMQMYFPQIDLGTRTQE